MNQRMNLQPVLIVFSILVILAVVALLAPRFAGSVSLPQLSSAMVRPSEVADQPFDAAAAADISAQRWQAMAAYYEREGLLTRDPFDYEQAADISAQRWLATGRGYERLGLLNDTMDAGDIAAFRWRAIGEGYERLGLLNE